MFHNHYFGWSLAKLLALKTKKWFCDMQAWRLCIQCVKCSTGSLVLWYWYSGSLHNFHGEGIPVFDCSWQEWILMVLSSAGNHHTCQPIQFAKTQYKIHFFSLFWGNMAILTGKWIQENVIFVRFCCCFKLSKKIEELSNEQLMNAITKCTLAGLVQYAKKSHQKWDLRLCMHI